MWVWVPDENIVSVRVCVNKVEVFINFENYKQFLLVRDYLFLLIKIGIE
jgi:hypothetical protein